MNRVEQGSEKPPTLALLTCLWQRHELTDLVLGWYHRVQRELAGRCDLRLMAVGSEGDTSRSLAESNGFEYVEYPNRPLGAKWNAGLAALADKRPDAVVISGSDDVLTVNLFERYVQAISTGTKYLGLLDMYFLDLLTRRFCFWPGYGPGPRHGDSLGLGRCIHADLLDEVDWQLWEPELNRTLDASMNERLAPLLEDGERWPARTLRCQHEGLGAVGMKSMVNIWSFYAVVRRIEAEYLDVDRVLPELFPADFVEALWRTRES